MERVKKLSIVAAITLVSTLIIALVVQAFTKVPSEKPTVDETPPIYNVWQFPDEDKVGKGFKLEYNDNYKLNDVNGYYWSSDYVSTSNLYSVPIGKFDSTKGGIAITQTFYNVYTESYTDGYPNLIVNTEGNVSYHNAGFSFRVNTRSYDIFFRSFNGADDVTGIDFLIGSSRYRYVGEKVDELYNDFKECGYVKCELFQEIIHKNEYLFGFKFSTANKSVTYNTLNTGDITSESIAYYCPVSGSHNEDQTYTVGSLLSVLTSVPLENYSNNSILAFINGAYRSTNGNSLESYNVFMNVADGSEYFNKVYWDYRNNVESIIDKYVPQA